MYIVDTYTEPSSIEGKGFFAKEFIPKGVVVYFYGDSDRFYSKGELKSLTDKEKELLFKYGVEDEFGNWNLTETGLEAIEANHSCDANILSLFVDGIYCDIAVKDIQEDEEITIDYGMFYSSYSWQMNCNCKSSICRKVAGSGISIDSKTKDLWYSRINESVRHIFEVNQPLFSLDNDKARVLTKAIKGKLNPRVFSYTKFTLISRDNKGA